MRFLAVLTLILSLFVIIACGIFTSDYSSVQSEGGLKAFQKILLYAMIVISTINIIQAIQVLRQKSHFLAFAYWSNLIYMVIAIILTVYEFFYFHFVDYNSLPNIVLCVIYPLVNMLFYPRQKEKVKLMMEKHRKKRETLLW